MELKKCVTYVAESLLGWADDDGTTRRSPRADMSSTARKYSGAPVIAARPIGTLEMCQIILHTRSPWVQADKSLPCGSMSTCTASYAPSTARPATRTPTSTGVSVAVDEVREIATSIVVLVRRLSDPLSQVGSMGLTCVDVLKAILCSIIMG